MITRWCVFVATLAVCALALRSQPVKVGIDNLVDTRFALLSGKRIALVSHAAARTIHGKTTAEVLVKDPSITVVRLLTPEHGFYGVVPAGESVPNDTIMGLPAVSLYGAKRRPDSSMMKNIDAVVLDLQDIGVRSYTYVSTTVEVMEACAFHGIPLFVLDRPNPWGGLIVDGSVLDDSLRSFIGRIPLPYVHGMTIGELAQMVNGEGWLSKNSDGRSITCSLTIVRAKRWTRDMRWEDIDRSWYPTSPNIPSPASARAYALTGLVGELGLLSIGIGSTAPFMVMGAPSFSLDTSVIQRCASWGVYLMDHKFTPSVGKYAKQVCDGYVVSIGREARPFRAALEILRALVAGPRAIETKNTLGSSQTTMFAKAIGSGAVIRSLRDGLSAEVLDAASSERLDDFLVKRQKYLLYP